MIDFDKSIFVLHQKFNNKYLVDENELTKEKPAGLSAFLRIREEGWMVNTCVESIIKNVDELIIVYCNSSDNTEIEIEQKKKKYPNKIRIYKYEPEVFPPRTFQHFITPSNSPHSIVNLNKWALCKTSYKYVLKLDADHITLNNLKIIRFALKLPRHKLNNGIIKLIKLSFCRISKNIENKISKTKLPLFIRKILINSNIIVKTYNNRDNALLALSGVNIGYLDNNNYYLFDSFPTVGHGDYGIVRRDKLKFIWSSNYEEIENIYTIYLSFSFWHLRIKKRENTWVKYNSYIPFFDNTFKLQFPDINKTFEDLLKLYSEYLQNRYIDIPENNKKININELNNNWYQVHDELGKINISKINYHIFWGIDVFEKKYLKYIHKYFE